MNLLIRNATVVDAHSSWNGKQVDILIKKGRIERIAKNIRSDVQEISARDLHVSAGWIDMKAHFCDPGHEYKEDLQSGLKAAKAGGFTSVVTMPSTEPRVDNKGAVEYLQSRSQSSGVKIYPAACLSKGMKGTELAEMVDLSKSGVRLFTDDKSPISDTSLMNRALLYAKDTGSVVASVPMDGHMSAHGKMHEGPASTRLGLTGIPAMAETIQLKRDLDLLRYTGSRMHISGLTTAEGVKLVKQAKKDGLDVTAEVHLANLIWTDEALKTYDTNFKLFPPLRSDKDRKALIKGVKDGTIDCISSDHRPEDVEHKKVEFGRAEFGMALIEHFYPLYNSHLAGDLELSDLISGVTSGPCKVLGLQEAMVEEGKQAILTLFSPSEGAEVARSSKAYNTPCIHPDMKGKVIQTIRS